jgi:2-alkyl-3-oxoalkanoate reductase
VHVNDAADAYALAVEKQPGFEAINVADDHPVPVKEFLTALAKRFGAKPPGRLPAFLVSLVAGHIVDAQVGSSSLDNTKAKQLLGWAPTLPSYREGIERLASDVQFR